MQPGTWRAGTWHGLFAESERLEPSLSATPRRRRWSLRLLTIFSTLVLTFVVLEVGVRAYAALFVPERSFFREDRLSSPFFLTYETPPPAYDEDGAAWFHHGRGPVSREKPAGVQRVLTLGGSTTVNRRAAEQDGRDYASWLEDSLNAAHAEESFEVLNCGGDAFSSAHSLVNLQLRLLELQPDTVVVMHNVNDLTANYYGGGAEPDYANKYLQPFYMNPMLVAGTSVKGFLNQSRLLAATGLLGGFDQGEFELEVDVTDGLRYFQRNLRAIGELCAREGIELILLTQPSQMREVPYYDLAHFQRYNRAIADVAEELGCRSIDMHARFGSDPAFFVDEFHYSPAGVQRFGELLAAEWREAGTAMLEGTAALPASASAAGLGEVSARPAAGALQR